MNNRRKFIINSTLGTLGLSLFSKSLFTKENLKHLTILHTNDMHSHIHPFKSGSNKGLGGMAQRAHLINKIRKENTNILLLDSGDIFQGTPYFNMYGGELELKLMSKMNYDACTIGNHDLDNGLNGLKKQLKHANFPFLIANYDFSDTILKDTFSPFKIFNKNGIRVGIFGIGIELDGLVPKKLFNETKYLDPIEISNKYSKELKVKHNCDLVICLSHLGFKYKSEKISDIKLASKTKNIDLILGGHTHTFLKKPVMIKNLEDKNVIINQVGYGGINIGKIDFTFQQNLYQIGGEKSSILVKNK